MQKTKTTEEVQEPAIEQVNDRTEFDKVIDEHSAEIGEHPNSDKKYVDPEDEVIDTRAPLTCSRLTHSLEITEYLLFLDLALLLLEKRIKGSPEEMKQTFLFYFFGMQEDYNKANSIKSYEKKYPIFGGYVGVDIALAQGYKKLLDEEEACRINWDDDVDGSKSYKYLKDHHILSFPDNDIKKLFEEPDVYIDLREKAYASYKGKFPENSKNPNSKDKKEREQSGFTSKVENLKERVKEFRPSLAKNKNIIIAEIFQNVATEVNDHLAKFGNEGYGKGGGIKLSVHEMVLFALFLINGVEMKNVTPDGLGCLMESMLGGSSETYRKRIRNCRDNFPFYCGYASEERYNEAKMKIVGVLHKLTGEDGDKKLESIIKKIKEIDGSMLTDRLKDPIDHS